MIMQEHTKQQFTVLYILLKVFTVFIICLSTSILLITKSVAQQTETFIVTLNINNEYSYDYEVIINEDETFSLPLKYTLEALDIKYKQNHLSKEVSFSNETVVDYKNQQAKSKDVKINFRPQKNKLIFHKQGILSGIQDEIFVPITELNMILEDKITMSLLDYSVSIETERDINIKTNASSDSAAEHLLGEVKELSVVVPDKHPRFSVDSLSINESFQSDFITEKDLKTQTSNDFYNNTVQSALGGRLFGGNFKIRTNVRNYNNNAFSFGGVNFNYKKEFDYHNLELGNISGLSIGEASIGEGVIGVNFNNYLNRRKKEYKLPESISEQTKINIYVDDKFYKTVDKEIAEETIDSINKKDLSGGNDTYKATIEQQDLLQPITLSKEKTKFAIIAGVTGYEDRFFSNYPITNDLTSKKIVSGLKLEKQLNSQLVLKSITVGDYIISTPNDDNISLFLSRSIPSLVLGLSKDFRGRQGISQIFGAEQKLLNNLTLSSEIGASLSKNRLLANTQQLNTFGYLGRIKGFYEKDYYSLYSSIYNYSPDFYLAGTSDLIGSSSFVNDKRGFNAGGSLNLKYFSTNAEYNLYNSNLDDYVSGGSYLFNDYNFNARVPITTTGSLSFYRRARSGENNSGKIESTFNRFNLNKRLSQSLSFDLRGIHNNFSTKFSDAARTDSNFLSKYNSIVASTSYTIPKNMGKVSLSHENNTTKTYNFSRDVNSVRVGYTFPTFHNLSTSFTVGYRYKSIEKDFDFSVLFDYMFSSGRTLSLSYQYNQQSGIFIDDLFLPKYSRHSFLVNLSDVFSLLEGSLKSNGYLNEDHGYINVITFLDTNQNGILDKGEIKIPEIPINFVERQKTAYTDKKGCYYTKSMPAGFYNIKLNLNELPTLLSTSKNSNTHYLAKIEPQKVTKIYFGLISTVGNISGTVSVYDELGREMNIPDMVITLNNEKGEEINYTTVSTGETYYFTGITPGTYTVSLDKAYMEEYGLVKNNLKYTVKIPEVYNEYVDIENFDLKYTQNFEQL